MRYIIRMKQVKMEDNNMEQLKCNICKITYSDIESIKSAKRMRKLWETPTGIAPCPILSCKGELQLINE